MNIVANTLRVIPVDDDQGDTIAATKDSTINPSALLTALATVLRDTIGRFEEISGRVTENVLTRGSAADHELIVALQDFDRLQQEFGALGDMVSHCAATWNGSRPSGDGPASFGYDAIVGITLSDLKDRLLSHLRNESAHFSASPANDDEIF